ncbi:Pentatricopeptide repeat-containing protein [Hibiscus syriacus]|uniref:Pentatricopeptide repeat-containing protein n=1 Tax=Hibiscus syriacus TaxID=106335 RepID=A0A6A3ASZ1_HIBSY|nr:Pentatricopeptide repeat-containing protein [Hibiscus syriacus]
MWEIRFTRSKLYAFSVFASAHLKEVHLKPTQYQNLIFETVGTTAKSIAITNPLIFLFSFQLSSFGTSNIDFPIQPKVGSFDESSDNDSDDFNGNSVNGSSSSCGATQEALVTPQTLLIMIRRYCAVQDVGRAINTTLMFCNKDVFPFNTKSFNIILNGWCSVIGSPREGEMVWTEMSKRGVRHDVVSCSSIMSCYPKASNLNKVLKLFTQMKSRGIEPDKKVDNAVIHALAKARHVKEAINLLKVMEENERQVVDLKNNQLLDNQLNNRNRDPSRKLDQAKDFLKEPETRRVVRKRGFSFWERNSTGKAREDSKGHYFSGEEWTMFVNNLSKRVSRRALRELFHYQGPVTRVFIPSVTNKPKYKTSTFAFIQFASEDSLRKAIENVNGTWIDGMRVSVGGYKVSELSNKGSGDEEHLGDAYPFIEIEFDERSLTGIVKSSFQLDFVQKALASEAFEAKIASWGYVWNSCTITFKSVEELLEESTKNREDLSTAKLLVRVASPFNVLNMINVGSFGRSFKVRIKIGSMFKKSSDFLGKASDRVSDYEFSEDASSEEDEDLLVIGRNTIGDYKGLGIRKVVNPDLNVQAQSEENCEPSSPVLIIKPSRPAVNIALYGFGKQSDDWALSQINLEHDDSEGVLRRGGIAAEEGLVTVEPIKQGTMRYIQGIFFDGDHRTLLQADYP